MYYCILLLICLVVIVSCEEFNIRYKQDDYDIKDVRIEIIFYNKSYFKYFKGDFEVWNNETDLPRLHNLTFQLIKEVPDDMRLKIDVFKLTWNEYKYFPINLELDLCVEIRRNKAYLSELMTMGRATPIVSNLPNGCPYKPGFHYIYNIRPDYSILPPFIPHGSYKAMGKLHHHSDLLGEANVLGTVVGKPKKNKKRHW